MQTTGSPGLSEMDGPREVSAELSASAKKGATIISWGMAGGGPPKEVVAFELDLSRLIQF